MSEGNPPERGVVRALRPPPKPPSISGGEAAGALAGSFLLGALSLLACVSGLVPAL